MMSKKQWFFVLCLFIIYLLLGASIFYHVESEKEVREVREQDEQKLILQNLLKKHFVGTTEDKKALFNRLTSYCGKTVSTEMTEEPDTYRWDFYHCLFMVITVVSTIGYGNYAPTTTFTRIFMIFYGLIGIPLNGIVMVTLGEFFAKSFRKLHQRWKKSRIDYELAKVGLIGQIILYLIPGFTFFIFLPSTIIMVFEGWPYDVCVYYSFVTLTTIGFGDFVAGCNDEYNYGELYSVYKIFLLFWIIGGLGYAVMIITFITQGLKSKKIIKIEQILSENLKQTPKKIRQELRSMLQELLFLRVKPVYKDDFHYTPNSLERSQSAPDLTMYKRDSPSTIRKRAMSECFREIPFIKMSSDTDLQRIDKVKTFLPSEALIQQTDLLLKVVDALNAEARIERSGFHGFPDHEILASEEYIPVTRKERRAISDVRPPTKLYQEAINANTWYGDDAAHAIREYRKRQRTMSTPAFIKPEKPTLLQRIKKHFSSREDNSVEYEKQNNNLDDVEKGKVPENARRVSQLSIQQEQVLEQTSIAELIRALSVVTAPQAPVKERKTSAAAGNLSPRTRRTGIAGLPQNRRTSLVPDGLRTGVDPRGRRWSLRATDETLTTPQLAWDRRIRKVSRNLMPPYKSSIRPDLYQSTSIPPTVPEVQQPPSPELTSTEVRLRKVSPGRTQLDILNGPPPYSAVPPSGNRRFSVKPTNLAYLNMTGPVQRQVIKRERTDTENSNCDT